MEVDSLNHFKSVFAHKLFVVPADYNYVIARWAYFNGYYREFFWEGLQSVEKYLKAALILNDEPVIDASHDISSLFSTACNLFGDLLPSILLAPSEVSSSRFRQQEWAHYIEDLNRLGHPNSRYHHLSYNARWSDIIKLDWTCFNLRRVTVGLNWIVGKDWPAKYDEEEVGRTYGETLRSNPQFQLRGELVIPEYRTEATQAQLRDLIHRFNFAYRRWPSDLSHVPDLAIMENSWLYLLSEALDEPNPGAHVIDGTKWLISVMKLSKPTKQYFERALKR